MEKMKLFSDRLRSKRESLKMSQTDFGRAVGVHRSTIADYEQTKRMPTTKVFNRMAKTLGVHQDWLLGLSDIEWDEEKSSGCQYKAGEKPLPTRLM